MCRELEQQLACGIESVPLGRHLVAATLADWGATEGDPAVGALDDVVLVAGELLSNGAKACTAFLAIRISAHKDLIRISVFDDNPEAASLQSFDSHRLGGRGLGIVEHLADRWGQAHTATSKEVWCEMSLTPGSALAVNCHL